MRSGREATPTAQHDAKRAPSRRRFVQGAGLFALGASPLAALAAGRDTGEGVTFADGPRPMVTYPQKRPLIRVHTRPPHLETPFSVFNEGPITANDAFFVRYHLANIPLAVDPATYRLTVKGKVNTPLNLSLAELKALAEPVEVVAVNQCSGNSRGYSSPRVFGAQLANGAMGNARWVGVPLRKVLEKAGVAAGARQVTFNGLDTPVLPATSDFRKALDIEHALQDEPMLAWGMNAALRPFKIAKRPTAEGRFEPISSIAIRWSPRSDFAPATIANRKCRITTYEVPQSTRSEKWTKRTGSVHRSAKFDGQVKNCYVVEFTDNEPSPLNVDLGVAPEKRQPFGNRSRLHLGALVFGKQVTADCPKKDRYKRAVCRLEVDGVDANLAQIEAGMAWHYKAYAREQSPADRWRYTKAEGRAREARQGLWADRAPVAPWDFRKARKNTPR